MVIEESVESFTIDFVPNQHGRTIRYEVSKDCASILKKIYPPAHPHLPPPPHYGGNGFTSSTLKPQFTTLESYCQICT